MRLIDADALINVLKDPPVHASLCWMTMADVLSLVDEAPTIDAVPVVRCKDCKYRKVFEYHYKDIGYCTTECKRGNEGVIGTCEDGGYCSDGERKAEP